MIALALIYFFLRWAITAMVAAGILLIILRAVFDYRDVNPFTWHARNVRRATDPVLAPARAILRGFRLDTKAAPFIVVILMIIAGVLIVQIAGASLNTIAGVLYAVTSHRRDTPVGIIGYLLFGALGLYTLAIFVRIIFSWVGMSYANRFMRLIVRLTEPLLRPLQRMIPRVGMFDISPLIAFLIIWVCQSAVAATLLRAWPVQFF
ncbi:MAG TPA: YggT family protein [Pyrinomonadaceae bacterium]